MRKTTATKKAFNDDHPASDLIREKQDLKDAANEARATLRQVKQEKEVIRKQEQEIIFDLLKDFLDRMQGYDRDNYVFRNRSFPFTKYVTRNYGGGYWTRGIDEAHRKALEDFNEAKYRLNQQFVTSLLEMDDSDLRYCVETWTLDSPK